MGFSPISTMIIPEMTNAMHTLIKGIKTSSAHFGKIFITLS